MRINPAAPIYPTPATKRDKPLHVQPRMTLDVTSQEVKDQEATDEINRAMDMIGQAVVAVILAVLPVILVFQVGRWMGWW